MMKKAFDDASLLFYDIHTAWVSRFAPNYRTYTLSSALLNLCNLPILCIYMLLMFYTV